MKKRVILKTPHPNTVIAGFHISSPGIIIVDEMQIERVKRDCAIYGIEIDVVDIDDKSQAKETTEPEKVEDKETIKIEVRENIKVDDNIEVETKAVLSEEKEEKEEKSKNEKKEKPKRRRGRKPKQS